jgi:hypothetical protein
VASEEYYPVKWVGFDTHPDMTETLVRKYRYPRERVENSLLIVDPIPDDEALARLKKGPSRTATALPRASLGLGASGIGGRPVMGRLTAELKFHEQAGTESWNAYREAAQRMLYPGDILLTANSLTGGTGSGFAPYLVDFIANEVMATPRLALNLSVLPSPREMVGRFPSSILCSLHFLLKNPGVSSVLLVDNGWFYDPERRSERPEGIHNMDGVNAWLREALGPVLLSAVAMHSRTDLAKTMDAADMKVNLKPHNGLGMAELGAIALAMEPLPRLDRHYTIDHFLSGLVQACLKRTSVEVGKEGGKIVASGLVAMVSAPPVFYERYLHSDAQYHGLLLEALRDQIQWRQGDDRRKMQVGFMSFPGLQQVRLTVLLAGVEVPRLTREVLNNQALPLDDLPPGDTQAERIRNIDSSKVMELYEDEVRGDLDKYLKLIL